LGRKTQTIEKGCGIAQQARYSSNTPELACGGGVEREWPLLARKDAGAGYLPSAMTIANTATMRIIQPMTGAPRRMGVGFAASSPAIGWMILIVAVFAIV